MSKYVIKEAGQYLKTVNSDNELNEYLGTVGLKMSALNPEGCDGNGNQVYSGFTSDFSVQVTHHVN